jgi:hypothetical protein
MRHDDVMARGDEVGETGAGPFDPTTHRRRVGGAARQERVPSNRDDEFRPRPSERRPALFFRLYKKVRP